MAEFRMSDAGHRWTARLSYTVIATLALCAQARSTEDECLNRVLTVARETIAANRITEELGGPQADISSDGSAIAFSSVEPAFDTDDYRTHIWVVDPRKAVNPQIVGEGGTVQQAASYASPRFSPDGRRIAYFVNTATGVSIAILERSSGIVRLLEHGKSVGLRNSWKFRVDAGLKWSPSGRHLATVFSEDAGPGENSRSRQARIEINGLEGTSDQPTSSIAIIDVETGSIEQPVDQSLFVENLDWSPAGQKLAFAASERGTLRSRMMKIDIYVVDLATRRVERIVSQPGRDYHPVWSPDGNRLAFLTNGGIEDWSQRSIIGVVDLHSGKISFPGKAQISRISADVSAEPIWSNDGKFIIVGLLSQLSQRLYAVPLRPGPMRLLTEDDLASYDNVRVSKVGTMVLARQSFEEPRDLFVTRIDHYHPHKLTNFSELYQAKVHGSAKAEIVAWDSADNQWIIHAGLISNEKQSQCSQPSRPLVVFAEGGPTMVRLNFNLAGQFPFVAFAEGGISILAPNTRGRSGYGKSFLSALENEGHWGSGPLSDILTGVDYVSRQRCLGQQGLLGIVGHSYGGYLTAYAITQTDAFRAAAIFDAAGPPLFPGDLYRVGAIPEVLGILKALYGMGSPFDPIALRALDHESPIPQLGRVTTPTLLEFGGAQNGGADQAVGEALFQGLKYFNVPSKFIQYLDSGHRISDAGPVQQMDSARRILEWYWYWVLNSPVPELVHEFGYRSPSLPQRASLCAAAPRS
jgi:dipeptidyl aminopeptidase/acylaminoacyl peptidase